MKKHCLSLTLSICILTGCSLNPKRINSQEASKYSSVLLLLEEKTGLRYRAPLGRHLITSAVQPFVYAKDYCAAQSGELRRVVRQNARELSQRVIDINDRQLLDGAFGTFACEMNEAPSWWLKITHSGIDERSGNLIYTTVNISRSDDFLIGLDAKRKQADIQHQEWRDKQISAINNATANIQALNEAAKQQQIDHFFNNIQRTGEMICRNSTITFEIPFGLTGTQQTITRPAQLQANFQRLSPHDGLVHVTHRAYFSEGLENVSVFNARAQGVLLTPGGWYSAPRAGWYLCSPSSN